MSRADTVASLAAPVLASWVPLAYLLAANADQASPVAAVVPAMYLAAANAAAVPLFRWITGSWAGAAVSVTCAWVLFFAHGPLFDRIWDQRNLEIIPSINRLLLACSAVLTLSAALLVRKYHAKLEAWPRWIILPAAFSLALSGFRYISDSSLASTATDPALPALASRTEIAPPTPSVDIYHIVLDGYARDDVLREVYGYDNSPFLHALRERGFRVLDQSFSNYSATFLSLSATLNGRYHEDANSPKKRNHYYRLIQGSWAASTLKDLGYRHHWVGTSWGGTEHSALADENHALKSALFRDEFSSVFWRGTYLRSLEPTVAHSHLFAFDSLESVAANPAPTFTFAHILAPHNPYVFAEDGSIIANVPQTLQFDKRLFTADKRWSDRDGYISQLKFINRRTLQAIDSILASPGPRPVIMLQSDHGSAFLVGKSQDETRRAWERHGVLNAILAPPEVTAAWPQPCTLVNSYPLLLNRLLNLELPTLPDRIHYSWYNLPYSFRDVTDALLTATPAEGTRGTGSDRNGD